MPFHGRAPGSSHEWGGARPPRGLQFFPVGVQGAPKAALTRVTAGRILTLGLVITVDFKFAGVPATRAGPADPVSVRVFIYSTTCQGAAP